MGTAPSVSDSPLRLDTVNQCLWRDGQTISLTPKAFTVLRSLMERQGQLVTKEELLNAAWPGVYVSDAALKVCIRRLRQALGDLAHPARYIETVHWRGYRLIAPIAVASAPVVNTHLPTPSTKTGPHHFNGNGGVADTDQIQLHASSPPLPLAIDHCHPAIPLVGRRNELATLQQLLIRAKQGERQTVFVTGAPGMGKSTLVEVFLASVASEPSLLAARGQCIEHYGAGESYLPVLEALNRLCRTPDGAQVIATLRRHASMWLAQLPSLLNPAERRRLRRETQGSSPERMLREMAEALEALTENRTLVLILEDLHWSDHATLDLVSFLARRSENARLLLIGVYRPDELTRRGHPLKHLKQDLQAHRRCGEIALPLLSKDIIDEYLQERFPQRDFPPVLASLLHQRTGGNPLFLVNDIEHFVSQGLIKIQDGCWRVNGALDDLHTETPISIQQIIGAQIDRLTPEERRILEVASVAGMEFSAATVAAALDADVAEIETCCEELARQGQFLRSLGAGEWPDGAVAARYEFIHSLYQQAWYERVTAGRRVRLHLRIAECGERAYGARVFDIAAELAVHFERGRDFHRAVRYRHAAANNAVRRFGYREAISHLTKGLQLLSSQPTSPERNQQEIVLQNALGAARMAIQGYAAPSVEHAYARARSLCLQVEASSQIAPALRGLWGYYLARGELHTAHTFAEQLFEVAQKERNDALLLEADRELGQTLYFLGVLPEARQYLERSIARYNTHEHSAHIFLYGQDPGVVCLAQNARTLCLLGCLDQARQHADAALTLAKDVGHPYSLALAQYHGTVVYQNCRDLPRTQAMAEATIALSLEQGFPYWFSSAQILKGWTLAQQGQFEAGIELMPKGLAAYLATGAALNRPYSLALLAEAYAAAGKVAEGLTLLQESLQSAEQNSGHFYLAEIYRLKAELTLQKEARDWRLETSPSSQAPSLKPQAASEAEAYFLKAIDIACQQQAKLLELRAVTSLCRLWQAQGKRKEAYHCLTAIYAWFTEGLDDPDVQAARALLDELF